jgi:methylase of polypeptide subunit release factors
MTVVVERLGDLLRDSGFGGRRAAALRADGGVLAPPRTLAALGRTDDARLALQLALFADSRTLSREQTQTAVGPLAVDELLAAGVLENDGDGLRSRLHVSAVGGLLLAGDPARDSAREPYVLSATPASAWLARLTVRRDVASALDLGTGSGVHALLATRHATGVAGVDVNPHALELARLSQRLNRIDDRVRWVEGDWLEPFAGERFDLVVANPPYVISPDSARLFRDGDAGGDELSRRLVRGCASALNDGGFATIMCSWIHRAEAWEPELRDWVSDLGCDALLLHASSDAPLGYAVTWNSGWATADPGRFDDAVARWVSHYAQLGVQRIATGFVVLRRRSAAPNWIRALSEVGVARGDAGDQVERMFAAGDLLGGERGVGQLGALLSRAWRPLDGHRLDQHAVYAGGAYTSEARMSTQPDSGIGATIDARVLAVVLACDGRRSLGELVDEAVVPDGIDRGAFQSLCIGAVRELVARGLLVAD